MDGSIIFIKLPAVPPPDSNRRNFMTWKERRNVTILLCIAGALFLALLVVFGMIYR